MARVAVFAATPLWDVHHAEVIELALREKAAGNHVIVVSCDRFHASCAANPFKTDSLCTDCLSQSRRTRDHFLKEDEGFEHVKLSSRPMRRPVAHRQVSSREQLLGFDYKGAPLGSLVMSQMADEKKDSLFSLQSEADARRANLLLASSIDFYEASVEFLRKKQVTRCFVWNGRRPSDGPAWWAAKSIGAEAFVFISGSRINRMTVLEQPSVQEIGLDEGRLIQLKSDLLKSGEFQKAANLGFEFLEGYRRSTIKALGAEKVNRSASLPPEIVGNYVLLLLSSPAEFLHVKAFQEFFLPDPYFWLQEVTEAVHESLPNHQAIVKWHPAQGHLAGNEATLMRQKIASLRNVVHIQPQDDGDAYLLAQGADIVFSMGSTVGLWAAAAGKPLFILGPEGMRFPDGNYWVSDKETKVQVTKILRVHGGVPPAKEGRWAELYVYWRMSSDLRFKHVRIDGPGGPQVGRKLLTPRWWPSVRFCRKLISSLVARVGPHRTGSSAVQDVS